MEPIPNLRAYQSGDFQSAVIRYLSLLMVGQLLLRRTLSLQIHEPLRQRVAIHYHLEGLSREELDTYVAHQLKMAHLSPRE